LSNPKNIIRKNIWIKISSFNSAAVIARLITAWIVNKLIAVYIGPQGTGLVEQFRNFVQSMQGLSGLGMQQGMTKYTAQYSSHPKKLTSFVSTSFRLLFFFSLGLGIFVYLFSEGINRFLFPETDFSIYIKLTGLLLPVLAFNLAFNAFLKGLQAYKTITYINISTNVFVAILAYFLIGNWQLSGAMALVIIIHVILFCVEVFVLFKKKYITYLNSGIFQTINLKRLLPYMIMALVTAVVAPFFSILIRNHIFNFFESNGEIYAGYWDATKKISALFLSLIAPVFAMYYYPQMAIITNSIEFKREVKRFLKQIFPLLITGLAGIYFFRKILIRLFFSSDYLPMENLFFWQLAGDFFQVVSLLFAYLMLAKAHIKLYIFSEIGFWLSYYLLTLWLTVYYDLQGVVIAYFLSYFLYFLFVFAVYGKYLRNKNIAIK